MRRAFQLIVSFLLAILAMMLAVSSCAPQSALMQQAAPTEAVVTPEPTPEPVEEPAQIEAAVETEAPVETTPEISPGPVDEATGLTMAEMTPAQRAAFWGLPEPPEGIDLNTREFLIANSYNNITETRPNHAYGAGVTVDLCAAEAFNNFVGDAIAAGYGLTAFRGYLDYWTVLENYYEPEVFAHNAAYAASVTYVPGCNDHQTATCIDLRLGGSGNVGEGIDFRGTEAWDWLLEHCADYGVILRYPEGQNGWYGYGCMNPGHFRYVGVDAAKYIMENNITLEQFVLLYDWEFIYVPGVNGGM